MYFNMVIRVIGNEWHNTLSLKNFQKNYRTLR
ncbi:hypothetical protein CF65_02851 [Aggregatibacter actinomycetemcomitans HK1651]|nr:hypothetical protein CF65_02851 [Aggregatibacter actinomycetemcomitans HK1651]